MFKKWDLVSLLDGDSKLIPKFLANRFQDVMPNKVNENQNAYVNNRFISQGIRLISDILEITGSLM